MNVESSHSVWTPPGPTKCLLYSYGFAALSSFMGSTVNAALGPIRKVAHLKDFNNSGVTELYI